MDSIRPDVLNFYRNLLCILVAGALGGRFDHEMGNVNTLCRFSTTRIVLVSDDCLVQLLPSTRHHEIHVLSLVEVPHCGLIPIGNPSGSSTTTGLQWNPSKYFFHITNHYKLVILNMECKCCIF
ncbi:putative thiamine diphosphokinase [Helianthus annuus]|nr:putative thiamine diphosphokinase [Helianthus annuus]